MGELAVRRAAASAAWAAFEAACRETDKNPGEAAEEAWTAANAATRRISGALAAYPAADLAEVVEKIDALRAVGFQDEDLMGAVEADVRRLAA
jgi:hypothetical protein